jgi:hypothetical protein
VQPRSDATFAAQRLAGAVPLGSRIGRRSSRREKHARLRWFSGVSVGRQRFTTMSGEDESDYI